MQESEWGTKVMEHEERQIDQDTASESQMKQEENSLSPAPIDAMLAKIRAQFGLSKAYLPENPTIAALLEELKSPNWRVRTAVARRLGSAGQGDDIRTALIEALHDPVPAVRAASARALGHLDDAIPEESLLNLLRNDMDSDVRTAAAQSLAILGEHLSPYAAAALEASFRRENEDDVTRAAIIYALGRLGKGTSIALLKEAMYHSDWLVREAAAYMMGEQEDHGDEDALLAVAENDESDEVVQAAYRSLGKLSAFQNRQLTENELHIRAITEQPPPEVLEAAYEEHRKVGEVEFIGIEPGSINLENRIPIVVQALDNQWVPRTLLNALLKKRVSLEAVQEYLTGLVRTEYLRALINGEQVIINRAFLYNNATVAQDYAQKGPNREAFKQFLSDGVIIPFLLYEKSPDEEPAYMTASTFTTWQQICRDVRMQCLRFSWLSDEGNKEGIKDLTSGLHRFTQNDQFLNIERLASDLGLPFEQIPALRDILDELHTWSWRSYKESGEYVRREELYRKHVTVGNPALRVYDGTRPFAGELKQLFDVAYNNNLAEALNGYLLTPVDSPTSLILQDWRVRGKNTRDVTTSEIVQMVRRKMFQIVQSGSYLRTMGLLSLQDVRFIRTTDEWRIYIKHLQQLLRAPLEFADRANDVYQAYIQLAAVISKFAESRKLRVESDLMAEWRPDVRLIINVGGSRTQLVWHDESEVPLTDATEQKGNLPKVNRGNAPVNVRMIIGDSSSQAKMHTSIDIIQGNMQNAQRQWRDLCDQFTKQLYLREFSTSQVPNTANLNAVTP